MEQWFNKMTEPDTEPSLTAVGMHAVSAAVRFAAMALLCLILLPIGAAQYFFERARNKLAQH